MKGFCLINESTDPAFPTAKVLAMVPEFQAQQIELAAAWQRLVTQVMQADSEAAAPQDDEWVLTKFVDTLDDPDALAYHTTTTGGRPLILIGVQVIKKNAAAGSDWVLGPDGVSTAASHELAEADINPYCSFYAPLDASTWIPMEVCDPTQGDTYQRVAGAPYVANFVTPRYYSEGAGPYDRMGVVTAPRQIRPGGYQQELVGGPNGTSNAVFGERLPAWKRKALFCKGSRFATLHARGTQMDELSQARRGRSSFQAMLDERRRELAAVRAELAAERKNKPFAGHGG